VPTLRLLRGSNLRRLSLTVNNNLCRINPSRCSVSIATRSLILASQLLAVNSTAGGAASDCDKREFFSSGSMDSPIIMPTAEHKGTVIFLHGLGDTGHGWSAGFETIKEPNLKYIFPTASVKSVSLNAGFPMPSWFDIYSLDHTGNEDEQGIKQAAADLLELVDKEASESKLPLNKIMIGGFSQGGATALYAAATTQKQLGGLIALSAWLPLRKIVDGGNIPHCGVPVMQCHGDADPMVNFNFGDMSHKLLLKKGMSNYTFKTYAGMSHGSSPQEMMDVKNFIKKTLL